MSLRESTNKIDNSLICAMADANQSLAFLILQSKNAGNDAQILLSRVFVLPGCINKVFFGGSCKFSFPSQL